MAFVQQLRSKVQKNRKIGFVQKLRDCVMESRQEEYEMEIYMHWMDTYKGIQEDPFQYTFDEIIMAEDALDQMLRSAVEDQRKHRWYAEHALKQMQSA
jgi:hypothetical protein